MNSCPTDWLPAHASGDAMSSGACPSFEPRSERSSRRDVRLLATDMGDNDLAAHGLRTMSIALTKDWLVGGDAPHGGDVSAFAGVPWLAPALLANDGRSADWMGSVLERLDVLRQVGVEEDIVFSESSAAAALEFLRQVERRPGVFLLPNGHIRLLWTNDLGEQVALEFMGAADIRFVMFVAEGGQLRPTYGLGRLGTVINFIQGASLARMLGR